MAAGPLRADPTIDWISDSYSSFDVILMGTGLGWSGIITSPSDLWQLDSANIIQYPFPGGDPNQPPVMLDNYGHATFLGQLPPQFPPPGSNTVTQTAAVGTFGGYQQFFQPVAPINDGNPLNYGYLCELSSFGPYENWSGSSTFSVTSIPDTNDVSTWTWMAEYSASGESLQITSTPEPDTLALGAVAILLGILSGTRRARTKKERPDTTPASMRTKR